MTNKPLTKFRAKGLTITVWPTSNGGFSGSVTKSWKKKDDADWTNTPSKEKPYLSLFKEELENLSILCKQAVEYMDSQGNKPPSDDELDELF